MPEIRKTLEETQNRLKSFSRSFNALFELFNTLDSSLHVEELVKLKMGKNVGTGIRDIVRQMSDCLAEKGLTDFSEKVHNRPFLWVRS